MLNCPEASSAKQKRIILLNYLFLKYKSTTCQFFYKIAFGQKANEDIIIFS